MGGDALSAQRRALSACYESFLSFSDMIEAPNSNADYNYNSNSNDIGSLRTDSKFRAFVLCAKLCGQSIGGWRFEFIADSRLRTARLETLPTVDRCRAVS